MQSTQLSRAHSREALPVTTADYVPPHDLEKATPGVVEAVPQELKLSIADVNPVGPALHVLRQRSNIAILLASGEHIGCLMDGGF